MWLRPLLRKGRSGLLAAGRSPAAGVLAVGLLVALAAVGLRALAPAVLDHPYFSLQRVKLASDSRLPDPEGLVSRAGLFRGTSLWRVDLARAREALERPAWVERVELRRRFPDSVRVRVYPRRPVAATIIEGRAYVVDAAGVVFRDEDPEARPDLPYLVGWQAAPTPAERMAALRRMVEVVGFAEQRSLRVSEVEAGGHGLMRVFPETPRLAITLAADTDLAVAFARLPVVLGNLAPALEDVGEVDLSYRDRVVVRSLPGRFEDLLTARAGAAPRAPAQRRVAASGSGGKRG